MFDSLALWLLLGAMPEPGFGFSAFGSVWFPGAFREAVAVAAFDGSLVPASLVALTR